MSEATSQNQPPTSMTPQTTLQITAPARLPIEAELQGMWSAMGDTLLSQIPDLRCVMLVPLWRVENRDLPSVYVVEAVGEQASPALAIAKPQKLLQATLAAVRQCEQVIRVLDQEMAALAEKYKKETTA